MLFLRTVNEKTGATDNEELVGCTKYRVTHKTADDFEKILQDSNWQENKGFDNDNHITAFLSCRNGSIIPLYGNFNRYYIMTETGKTFERIYC